LKRYNSSIRILGSKTRKGALAEYDRLKTKADKNKITIEDFKQLQELENRLYPI